MGFSFSFLLFVPFPNSLLYIYAVSQRMSPLNNYNKKQAKDSNKS